MDSGPALADLAVGAVVKMVPDEMGEKRGLRGCYGKVAGQSRHGRWLVKIRMPHYPFSMSEMFRSDELKVVGKDE